MFVSYVYGAVLLGILIIVHEIGHFLAARAAGVSIERFSIGFGPRILTLRRGGTEYALSAVPLGGYVKMAGSDLAGRSFDGPPPPHTFPGKPLGVRALIVAAGPAGNLAWALVVYVAIVWVGGLPAFQAEPVIGYVEPGSPAETAGIQVLDRVVAIEGTDVGTWEEMRQAIVHADASDGVEIVIERGDPAERLRLVVDAEPDAETGTVTIGVASYMPPLVGDVMRGSPADRAGLETGDRILEVDGSTVTTWYDFQDVVSGNPGRPIEIVWEHAGEERRAVVVPDEVKEAVGPKEVRTVGSIGASVPLTTRPVGFAEAIATGARLTVAVLRQVLRFFWLLVTLQVSSEMVGGPIRVVQMASESARWGASYFFFFMAYLSVNLSVINLLPLPILDGGHLALLGLERLRGRGLTERQLMVWQQVGLVVFGVLLAFLLVRDALFLR